jgi:hypothetical protein
VLRPVLKLQNDIFIQIFKDYAVRKISDFTSLKNEQKINFTEQSLQRYCPENTFIGITIGMPHSGRNNGLSFGQQIFYQKDHHHAFRKNQKSD